MSFASAVAHRPVLGDRLPAFLGRDLLACATGVLFIAISAQVAISLPFTPVPITGSTLGVLLSAATLGARRGSATIVAYISLGVVGMPIFTGGNAGLAYLLGSTGGYLLGFMAAGWIVGHLSQRGVDRQPVTTLISFMTGSVIIYAVGVPWLAFVLHVSFGEAVRLGAIPFLPGDILKALLAAGLLPLAWRLVGDGSRG